VSRSFIPLLAVLTILALIAAGVDDECGFQLGLFRDEVRRHANDEGEFNAIFTVLAVIGAGALVLLFYCATRSMR
jgi:hypothetical protein